MCSLLSQGLAGIQPVDDISGIENVTCSVLYPFHTQLSYVLVVLLRVTETLLDLQVDVTQLIDGHSSYLWMTKQILEQLELENYYPGFKTIHPEPPEEKNSRT